MLVPRSSPCLPISTSPGWHPGEPPGRCPHGWGPVRLYPLPPCYCYCHYHLGETAGEAGQRLGHLHPQEASRGAARPPGSLATYPREQLGRAQALKMFRGVVTVPANRERPSHNSVCGLLVSGWGVTVESRVGCHKALSVLRGRGPRDPRAARAPSGSKKELQALGQ